MLSVGANIQTRDDKLMKVKVEYLYNSLKNPKPEIAAKIRQLRIVRELDVKQYSVLKRQLPYIVCGNFNPAIRRTENFAYTEYFIIDIDHIEDKGLDMEVLRAKLKSDERVLLMFVSPGEDGLKLLFRLSERCYDAGLYTVFYKAFLQKFSQQYGLSQVIDSKTCDVARACFISIDPDAYYNSFALEVDMKAFIDTANPMEAFAVKVQTEAKPKLEDKEQKADKVVATPKVVDPSEDILQQIKQQLKMKSATREKPEKGAVYVPEQLNMLMADLSVYIADQGIEITDVRNIQYAKKLSFRLGLKTAEVNIFYGKHGYRVVLSPKSGTSAELNSVVAELIENYIHENC